MELLVNPNIFNLKDLLGLYEIESIADFGCCSAGWLGAAKRMGVGEVKGYDLAEISISDREISSDEFQEVDLSKPIDTGRKYDLVISSEVAEHIPEESA